jgi:hypothetical protein
MHLHYFKFLNFQLLLFTKPFALLPAIASPLRHTSAFLFILLSLTVREHKFSGNRQNHRLNGFLYVQINKNDFDRLWLSNRGRILTAGCHRIAAGRNCFARFNEHYKEMLFSWLIS